MNRRDILFQSNRFNLSEIKPHFINPCCFGEDLARWLASSLAQRGIRVGDLHQEDWGWEFAAAHATNCYYIGVGGNSLEIRQMRTGGEWRVMISKRRSLVEKITRKSKLKDEEPIIVTLLALLQSEPSISDVHLEMRTKSGH